MKLAEEDSEITAEEAAEMECVFRRRRGFVPGPKRAPVPVAWRGAVPAIAGALR